MAEREAQEIKLFLFGGKQEIALIAVGIGGTMQFGPAIGTQFTLHIMARGHAIRAQVVRGFQQIAEFDGLIAFHAGDRGFAAHIAIGKIINHFFAEA